MKKLLAQIDTLLDKREYEAALNQCRQLEQEYPEHQVTINKQKARVFYQMGNKESAHEVWSEIIELGEAELPDYYLAADNLIALGKYDKAISCLHELLDLSEKKGETWFLDANLYFLSYCYAKLKNRKKAQEFYDIVKESAPDFEIPMPDSDITGDLECLEDFINRIPK